MASVITEFIASAAHAIVGVWGEHPEYLVVPRFMIDALLIKSYLGHVLCGQVFVFVHFNYLI